MSPAFDLEVEAISFARRLSDLLNATVCNGVHLRPVVTRPGRVVVGYRITKQDQDVRRGIPMALGQGKPTAYLGLAYRLQSDDEQQYLTVTSSFVGLFADPEFGDELLHYDYERDKGDDYPEAHLQVAAEPPAWQRIRPPGRPFSKVHLPVGGRRYRPTLEDVIEMCIVERVAEGRPGWRVAVNASRKDFQARQLRERRSGVTRRLRIRCSPSSAATEAGVHAVRIGDTRSVDKQQVIALAREAAQFVPDVARLFRDVVKDPRVPTRVKVEVGAAAAYLVLPIDVIPDFIPGIGQLDDLAIVGWAVRRLLMGAGENVLREHWQGTDRGIEILLQLAASGLRPRKLLGAFGRR